MTDFRLYNCDAIAGLRCVKSQSIDAVVSDPPYAEITRQYGRLTEPQWHELMDAVVTESMRVLKPSGSAMFVLQPNYECIGKMRLWVWEFLIRTAKKWNLIQNAYWHNPCAAPTAGTDRVQGLMRPSVKYCLWFGDPSCNRYQDSVLKEMGKFDIRRLQSTEVKKSPSGTSIRDSSAFRAATERGGSTPFNLLTLTNTGNRTKHPAATPLKLAEWWVRYLTKPGDIVLDPFSGSATTGVAAIESGRGYVGFEKEEKYHLFAKDRLAKVKKPLEKPRGEEVER